MPRLAMLALVLAIHASPVATVPQDRPPQADAVVRLLSDLEDALTSGRIEDFRALAAADIAPADIARFALAVGAGPATSAAVRERARRVVPGGVEILTEVLVQHGRDGRIATWQITARPRPGASDRVELSALIEIAAVDGLIQLVLDSSRQFALRDFSFTAPDFVLRIGSGSAFVAESTNGVTALVLNGRGQVTFTPPDPAEQGQLRIFAGRPAYTTDIEAAFIRINPQEFDRWMTDGAGLVSTTVSPDALQRARAVFAEMAERTYTLDLRDLAAERWSLEPAAGSLVVEFHSRRHGWLTYARSPNEPEDISFFDRARTRNISVYTSAEKLAARGRYYSEDDEAAYDVTHYDVDLAFDPARAWISGRGSLRLTIRRDVVNTLNFKLAGPLAIGSVTSPAFGHLLTLRIVGQNNVIVTLPQPLPRGTEVVLDVVYSGRLPPQALDREALAPSGQVVTVQDPAGGERILLVPEPRFMYSNRVHWYPQGEYSDYATATMRLTVPSEYQIVASGRVMRSTLSEGPDATRPDATSRRTVEYRADRPARYLSCVISRFVPVSQVRVPVPAVAPPAAGSVPAAGEVSVGLEVVSTPRMTRVNRQMADRVAAILRFYAQLIGEAPYPDFTLVGIDDNLPGGHSPAFFAILHQPLPTTPYSWTSDPVAFDHVYPHLYLAHEVAHQWWGQAVGWKNYHEQWLSEGLAQYFAVLYAGADRGPDVVTRLVREMRDSAARHADQGPISLGYRLGHLQNDGRIFRATVYNKSVVVLHMLRRFVGDDAFFGGLRDFYAGWRFRKAGTGDLATAFEARAGRSLGAFFDGWIFGTALPRLRVTSRIDNARLVATVRVEQQEGRFALPVTLQIQYRDGPPEEVDLVVTETEAEFRVPLRAEARRIQVRDELVLGTIRQ